MRKLFGLFLVIVGTLILLTPFTPGSILLVVGLDILFGHKVKWWLKLKKKIYIYIKKIRQFARDVSKR